MPLQPVFFVALAAALVAGGAGYAEEPAFRVDPSVLEDLGARFDHKGLRSVSDVLASPAHPDHDWVRRVHERLATVGQGSSVVLYRTRRGAAVLVTAAHVLPYDTLASARPPKSGLRVLFVPPITRQEYDREVPRDQDFAILLVDGHQPSDPTGAGSLNPGILPGIGSLSPGQEVLLMGAPAVGNLALMYSVGRVLGEEEASRRDPHYHAGRQFVIQASASGRMSGGGAFARDGSYLGVITTGYFKGHPKALVSDYVGGVAATWIEKAFLAHLAGLPEAERQALKDLMR